MSDLEYVTLSFASCVLISVGLVCIKCHKMYMPSPEDDLCQTNDRAWLQRQTHPTHLGRDKKTKTKQTQKLQSLNRFVQLIINTANILEEKTVVKIIYIRS